MPKYTGTLRWSDLEGGLWTLEEDSGNVSHLVDESKVLKSFKDGDSVVVDVADNNEEMCGIGMVGSVLVVSSVKLNH